MQHQADMIETTDICDHTQFTSDESLQWILNILQIQILIQQTAVDMSLQLPPENIPETDENPVFPRSKSDLNCNSAVLSFQWRQSLICCPKINIVLNYKKSNGHWSFVKNPEVTALVKMILKNHFPPTCSTHTISQCGCRSQDHKIRHDSHSQSSTVSTTLDRQRISTLSPAMEWSRWQLTRQKSHTNQDTITHHTLRSLQSGYRDHKDTQSDAAT